MEKSELSIKTSNRGMYAISSLVNKIIKETDISNGLCNLFIKHTSCSIIVSENCDKKVLNDFEYFMQKLIPDGEPWLTHTSEGIDDMPSHIRSVLTCANVNIPVVDGVLDLGVWQEVYLWEHRFQGRKRNISINLY